MSEGIIKKLEDYSDVVLRRTKDYLPFLSRLCLVATFMEVKSDPDLPAPDLPGNTLYPEHSGKSELDCILLPISLRCHVVKSYWDLNYPSAY